MTVPMYVKVDRHKEIQQMLGTINLKLANVEKTLDKINQIKSEEDLQLQSWRENLADVRARLQRINSDLSG